MKSLNDLSKEIHLNAKQKGFWEKDRNFGEMIALCHSELSEALEAHRDGILFEIKENGKPEGWSVELADCLIRILDICGHYGIDMESLIEEKMSFNRSRPYKHNRGY